MSKEIISLFELSQNIKETIKNKYNGLVWVRAEIAEFKENKNGHCYLDLIEKQENSDQISARVKSIIWAFTYRMLKPYFETSTGRSLSNGLKVLVQVSVEYHEVFGLSLNINDIDPTFTIGDLEQRKREIINQLCSEGVMEMNKETDFSIVPQRIAIISSSTAAGYGDFVNQLENNQFGIKFYHHLFPAIMQGEQAPSSIIAAFDKIYENIDKFDVTVIIRGGGASIDLLCFDNYSIAYYITQFPMPVLTGIGHERDNTIVDMVAYKTLKTPTAVAEFIITHAALFLEQIDDYSNILEIIVKEKLDKQIINIEKLTQQTANILKQRLLSCETDMKIKSEKLIFLVNLYIKNKIKQLEFLEKQNTLNDPMEILKKGFTLTYFNNKIIKQASMLKQGDLIETKFYNGSVKSISI